MKAVIMAGGEGTRLKPVTCGIPKPMVPILGKPVMEHTVNLLKGFGIREVAVTLHHMPHAICEYFGDGSKWGTSIKYYIERTPMGTAGSVRAASDFLNDTFVVISGDALTDIDLKEAYDYHRQKGAEVTIVLKRVNIPIEYGIVICAEDGSVERFAEKPLWNEVFSNTANTGIYIIEPHVMEKLEKDKNYDFAKDLFPMLLREKAKMFGYVMEGYWCDIGNPKQYIEAHLDALSNKVNLSFEYDGMNKGIFVAEGAYVERGAELRVPCAIMDGAKIRSGAAVGPFAFVGKGSLVKEGSSIEYSVLLDNTVVGMGCRAEHSLLCEGSTMYERATISNAVLGREASLGEGAMLHDASVWPGVQVKQQSNVDSDVREGQTYPLSLFGVQGIRGVLNKTLPQRSIQDLGQAFASLLPEGAKIGLSTWGGGADQAVEVLMEGAILCGGGGTHHLGILPLPVARYACRRFHLDGMVHVMGSGEECRISFMDQYGADIDGAMERKLEDSIKRGSLRTMVGDQVHKPASINCAYETYLKMLSKRFAGLKKRELSIQSTDEVLKGYYEQVLKACGFKAGAASGHLKLEVQLDGSFALLWPEHRLTGAALHTFLALMMEEEMPEDKGKLPLSSSMEYYLQTTKSRQESREVYAQPSDWMGSISRSDGERRDQWMLLFFDGLYASLAVMEKMEKQGKSIQELASSFPHFYSKMNAADCPIQKRGDVMRELIKSSPDSRMMGAFVLRDGDGLVTITPDKNAQSFSIKAESMNMEVADELVGKYTDKIRHLVDPNPQTT